LNGGAIIDRCPGDLVGVLRDQLADHFQMAEFLDRDIQSPAFSTWNDCTQHCNATVSPLAPPNCSSKKIPKRASLS
jgi:hypothetical protein